MPDQATALRGHRRADRALFLPSSLHRYASRPTALSLEFASFNSVLWVDSNELNFYDVAVAAGDVTFEARVAQTFQPVAYTSPFSVSVVFVAFSTDEEMLAFVARLDRFSNLRYFWCHRDTG